MLWAEELTSLPTSHTPKIRSNSRDQTIIPYLPSLLSDVVSLLFKTYLGW